MYHKLTPDDLEALRQILPKDRVLTGDEILSDYYHDELSGTEAPPEVLVFVLSTEEASAVMRYAYEHDIPVTTRGAGTGLVGAAVAVHGVDLQLGIQAHFVSLLEHFDAAVPAVIRIAEAVFADNLRLECTLLEIEQTALISSGQKGLRSG